MLSDLTVAELNFLCEKASENIDLWFKLDNARMAAYFAQKGTYEELPGADGEPDYCGLTFKQRPVA